MPNLSASHFARVVGIIIASVQTRNSSIELVGTRYVVKVDRLDGRKYLCASREIAIVWVIERVLDKVAHKHLDALGRCLVRVQVLCSHAWIVGNLLVAGIAAFKGEFVSTVVEFVCLFGRIIPRTCLRGLAKRSMQSPEMVAKHEQRACFIWLQTINPLT